MFCPFCGNEVKDGSVFCQKCGKRLVNEAANSAQVKKETETSAEAAVAETKANTAAPVSKAPKKKLSKNALIGIIAGAAALVLAIILIVVLVSVNRNKDGKSNFAVPSGAIEYFEKDGYLYLVNSKGALTRVDLDGGEVSRYDIKFDSNNEKAVFAVERNSDNWLSSSSYDVYYYDGKSAVKIDEITDEYYYDDFQISFTGNVVVYAKDDNIYSYSGGKSALIAEDAELSALSPDGKTIGYYKRTEDKVQGYYFTGGKEHFVINSGYPVFITNNADIVYIMREGSSDSSTFYAQKKDKEDTRVKLWNESDVSSGGAVNYDGTQLLVLKDDGSYYCKNGKELVKVSNKKLLPLIPYGVLGNGYMSGQQVIKDLEKAVFVERPDNSLYSSNLILSY
ncbi:MAG: zinc-ribbon domain-containing protein [Clostridia bacterium]|nr:zinc-ribbon domain-containing protein [Clostridia bacterium]